MGSHKTSPESHPIGNYDSFFLKMVYSAQNAVIFWGEQLEDWAEIMAALLSRWLKNLRTDKELENKVLRRTLGSVQNNKRVPKPLVSSFRSFLASETQDPENTFIGFPNIVFFSLCFIPFLLLS